MRLFDCQHCGQLLYFENTRCEQCGHILGYLPELSVLSALLFEGDGIWRPLAAADRLSRLCANAAHGACNRLVPAAGVIASCDACGLNRTIPALRVAENLRRWQRLEAAKHRLVYGLLRLRLPLIGRAQDPRMGFDFDTLVGAWLPLTYAVNSLNHSVGRPDLYPFVLAPTVPGKLRFVHGLIHRPGGDENCPAELQP